MEEILLQSLAAIAELLLEVFFEFAVELLAGLISRVWADVFSEDTHVNPVFAAAGYCALGALVGGATLLLFPHPLVPPSRFRGISLLISPLGAGTAMSLFGRYLKRRNRTVMQIETFGYASAFAFGMALVRLFFVS